MGRHSLKPQRREDLIAACIRTIHEEGLEGASLARIAKRAGLTAGIVAHYFGDKAELMDAAMRSIAFAMWARQSRLLAAAGTPMRRLEAVIEANLGGEEFRPEVTSVWLAFWARVNHSPRLARIQRANAARLESNLRHALRPLVPPGVTGPEAEIARIALGLLALIDGAWLHAALGSGGLSPAETRAMALRYAQAELARLETR
ncbi:MAG: transcriptional regulator BetI [Rhodospirillaceae bacterium]